MKKWIFSAALPTPVTPFIMLQLVGSEWLVLSHPQGQSEPWVSVPFVALEPVHLPQVYGAMAYFLPEILNLCVWPGIFHLVMFSPKWPFLPEDCGACRALLPLEIWQQNDQTINCQSSSWLDLVNGQARLISRSQIEYTFMTAVKVMLLISG
jgi:hypothetical protein